MEDLISVIIPVYNAEEYLSQCIESVINQTYRELEIIIVDDGSTDNSGYLCDRYAAKDNRIQVIHKQNEGVLIARNVGIDVANGAYIGFVDSDDYIEKSMYEKMLYKLIESKADFIHTGMIAEEKKYIDFSEGKILFNEDNKSDFLNTMIFENIRIQYILCTKLFKAELIKTVYKQVPEEQANYGEDLLLLCMGIMECNSIYLYADAFYNYRIRKDSLSHRDMFKTCLEETKLYNSLLQLVQKYNMEERCTESIQKHYMDRIIGLFRNRKFNEALIVRYRFNSPDMLKNKNIILYGAGAVGQDYYSQISKYMNCHIVAWVDKNTKGTGTEMFWISDPRVIKDLEYDILLIAVKKKSVADQIKDELLTFGLIDIDSNIIWEEPICLW